MKLALPLACLLLAATFVPSLAFAQSQSDAELAKRRAEERLTFQSGDPWTPRINVNADAAMVYGIGPKMPGLVTSWRDHGYIVDLMTGWPGAATRITSTENSTALITGTRRRPTWTANTSSTAAIRWFPICRPARIMAAT